MKQAFLIAAHEDPKQLYRLVNALQSCQSTFYIHIDRKNEYMFNSPYFKRLQMVSNVHFIESIKVYWGGVS